MLSKIFYENSELGFEYEKIFLYIGLHCDVLLMC